MSGASWKKHGLVRQACHGQICAWRASHPRGKIAVIDANAGDGKGVPQPQRDLFLDASNSVPTSALAVELAGADGNADVFLCEKNVAKRENLRRLFPGAVILGDHAEAPARLAGYSYALVISDPCGARDHGVNHLREIAETVPRADFVIVFGEQFLIRLQGVVPSDGANDSRQRRAWETARQRYGPMLDPRWWCAALKRKHIARTCRVAASPAFHFRILVVANHLSDAVQRRPFEVIHDNRIDTLSRD
jgi:hypothetical protein